MNFEKQLDLTGKEKPFFAEGQTVRFTTSYASGTGIIRGLSSRHLLDFWIVEIKEVLGGALDKAYYPWSCVVMSHAELSAE